MQNDDLKSSLASRINEPRYVFSHLRSFYKIYGPDEYKNFIKIFHETLETKILKNDKYFHYELSWEDIILEKQITAENELLKNFLIQKDEKNDIKPENLESQIVINIPNIEENIETNQQEIILESESDTKIEKKDRIPLQEIKSKIEAETFQVIEKDFLIPLVPIFFSLLKLNYPIFTKLLLYVGFTISQSDLDSEKMNTNNENILDLIYAHLFKEFIDSESLNFWSENFNIPSDNIFEDQTKRFDLILELLIIRLRQEIPFYYEDLKNKIKETKDEDLFDFKLENIKNEINTENNSNESKNLIQNSTVNIEESKNSTANPEESENLNQNSTANNKESENLNKSDNKENESNKNLKWNLINIKKIKKNPQKKMTKKDLEKFNLLSILIKKILIFFYPQNYHFFKKIAIAFLEIIFDEEIHNLLKNLFILSPYNQRKLALKKDFSKDLVRELDFEMFNRECFYFCKLNHKKNLNNSLCENCLGILKIPLNFFLESPSADSLTIILSFYLQNTNFNHFETELLDLTVKLYENGDEQTRIKMSENIFEIIDLYEKLNIEKYYEIDFDKITADSVPENELVENDCVEELENQNEIIKNKIEENKIIEQEKMENEIKNKNQNEIIKIKIEDNKITEKIENKIHEDKIIEQEKIENLRNEQQIEIIETRNAFNTKKKENKLFNTINHLIFLISQDSIMIKEKLLKPNKKINIFLNDEIIKNLSDTKESLYWRYKIKFMDKMNQMGKIDEFNFSNDRVWYVRMWYKKLKKTGSNVE